MDRTILLSVKPLAELASPPPVKMLPIGIPAVDSLTGIPCATLTEIYGPVSSGRTALVFSMLRQAIKLGGFCAWVDVQNAFDPPSAAAAGIQLNRLFWVRCGGDVEAALKAADLLIHAGGFAVVVMDLAGAPTHITRRIPLTSWFRLRHGAEQSGAALIAIGGHLHASSCSRLQLEMHQQQEIWSDKLLRGIAATAVLRKRNNRLPVSFRIVQ